MIRSEFKELINLIRERESELSKLYEELKPAVIVVDQQAHEAEHEKRELQRTIGPRMYQKMLREHRADERKITDAEYTLHKANKR